MLKTILQSLFGEPHPRRPAARDPILGELTPDELGWTAKVSKDADQFEFTIGGVDVPDPALIAHAHDILNDFASFKKSINEFIETETRDYPDEMKPMMVAFQIAHISLCWPDRPNDGMIYFRGPADDIGVWRCDYVNRKPRCLGCDT